MKTNFNLLVCMLLALLIVSCNNTDQQNKTNTSSNTAEETDKTKGQAFVKDDEAKPTVLHIAIGSKDHSTLVAAVQAADLENALVNAGPLMVFAPTNDAFAALPEGTVDNLLKPENKDQLAYILKHHVTLEITLRISLKNSKNWDRPAMVMLP